MLMAYSLITGTEINMGEIIYSDLITKLLSKTRNTCMSYPRFISCALERLLDSDNTKDVKIGFTYNILSPSHFKKDPAQVHLIALTDHMIFVINHADSVSPPPLSLKKKGGKSQTATPTLPKLQDSETSGDSF